MFQCQKRKFVKILNLQLHVVFWQVFLLKRESWVYLSKSKRVKLKETEKACDFLQILTSIKILPKSFKNVFHGSGIIPAPHLIAFLSPAITTQCYGLILNLVVMDFSNSCFHVLPLKSEFFLLLCYSALVIMHGIVGHHIQ